MIFIATESTMSVTKSLGEVDSIKQVVLSSTHTHKDQITASILEFKSKFNNRIVSLTGELSENNTKTSMMISDNELAKKEFDRSISVLQDILGLEKKKLVQTKTKTNDPTHTKNVENLTSEIQKCDADIQKIKKENESLQTKITSITEQLVLTKTEITGMNDDKCKLQTNLTNLSSETATLSASMKTSDDRLVELIISSECQTSLIKTAVEGEFDSYNSSIDKAKSENAAADIEQPVVYINSTTITTVEKQRSTQIYKKCPFDFEIIDTPFQKWGTKQTEEYRTKLTEYAKTHNNNNPLSKKQLQQLRENVTSSASKGEPLPRYPDKVTGAWCNVSASEVDISEFSMDELAAHVENLTAELRAL